MPRKQTETPADVVAVEEIYNTARAAADQELTEMRESINAVHNSGLMAGRAQGFKAIKLMAEFLEDKQIAEIIDKKEYLKIPGVESVNDYLEMLGLGRSVAYEKLKIARTLTAEEVRFFGQVGFTRRDLLGYASLPDEARMEIRDGKVINLENADREEIRKVIEDILLENKKVTEDTATEIRVRDKEIAAKRELIKKQEKELTRYENQAQARGLTLDENAFITQVTRFRDLAQGALIALDPNAGDNILPAELTLRMRTAVIAAVHTVKMQALAIYDTVVTQIGDPTINPEVLEDYSRWEEENGFKSPPAPLSQSGE